MKNLLFINHHKFVASARKMRRINRKILVIFITANYNWKKIKEITSAFSNKQMSWDHNCRVFQTAEFFLPCIFFRSKRKLAKGEKIHHHDLKLRISVGQINIAMRFSASKWRKKNIVHRCCPNGKYSKNHAFFLNVAKSVE